MLTLPCLLLSVLPAQPVVEPGPIALPSLPKVLAAPEEFPPMEYTYVEANYVWLDSDALNDTIDGWELTGSLELPMNFFLQGTARQLSGVADIDTYTIGAGWHFGLVPRLDAYGILQWQSVDVSGGGNDDGAGAELGLRFSLTKAIELNGRFRWSDIDDSDSSGGVGGRYYFSESLSAGANWDAAGDDTVISTGLRFEF
jgi:hypothetical protein